MGNFGWTEMFFIVAFALIVFGPRKLPEIAKTLGHAMAQLRRASEEFKRTWETEVERETAKIEQPRTTAVASTSEIETNEIGASETGAIARNAEMPADLANEISAGMSDSIANELNAADAPAGDVRVDMSRGIYFNNLTPEPEATAPAMFGPSDPSAADDNSKSDEKHPVSIA
jgi:sec-independent protein translocase protein TatB